ncbi:MAG: biotin--[acetyl-CoA-carboxylase] ligase [Eubacterium sp.]|nr:biotin--[acetyl-CoA-carboxylase] ligase [Eubacterium sp.]
MKEYEMPDTMTKQELECLAEKSWVGADVVYYETLDSTNTTAMQLAAEGAIHGTLVVADCQRAGKGRRGRSWEMTAGDSIAMSLILKPEELLPMNAPMLTLVSAIAVARALEQETGMRGSIKWPNDIVIDGKKICGILTEMSTDVEKIRHIVVGIGVNVHEEGFAEELADRATSLYMVSGRHFKRAQIVRAICEQFAKIYEIFMRTQDLSVLQDVYNDYLINRHQQVLILDPHGTYEAVAEGIDERGALLVHTADGMRAIDSGEVSVRGVYGYV